MKNIIVRAVIYFSIAIFFPACITLTNLPTTKVGIYSDTPISVVHDSIEYASVDYGSEHFVSLNTKRKKEDLKLQIKEDSNSVELSLPSQLDKKIYYNAGLSMVGFIPDLLTSKRFTYPRYIHVDSLLNTSIYKKDKSVRFKNQIDRKGMFTLNLGFPYINVFSNKISIVNKRKTNWGFMGISLGGDYYYHYKKYFNLTIGAVVDFPIFVLAPISYGNDVHDYFSSLYLQLTHNHRVGDFSYGYGLMYSADWWNMDGYPNEESSDFYVEASESNTSLGLALNASYLFDEKFYLGVNYRPSIVEFTPASNKFELNHYLSVEFGFKFILNKKKK